MERKVIRLNGSEETVLTVPEWCKAVYIEFLDEKNPVREISATKLRETTSEYFGCDIREKTHKTEIAEPRRMFCMLASELQIQAKRIADTLGFSRSNTSQSIAKGLERLTVDKVFERNYQKYKQAMFEKFDLG